ncbi:MAG: GGDEF domain-containing protein, partial [Sphingomicrobium sp.]
MPVRPVRRGALMMSMLIAAIFLLVWNSSSLFGELQGQSQEFGPEIQTAMVALMLNIALIFFGWRNYVELLHEAELRADGERRAALLASTDVATGLLNRKGFADRGQGLCQRADATGRQIVIVSIQIHRFKAISDRHGYETGDELLRALAAAMTQAAGKDSIVARLSGDEFAVAFALKIDELPQAERIA